MLSITKPLLAYWEKSPTFSLLKKCSGIFLSSGTPGSIRFLTVNKQIASDLLIIPQQAEGKRICALPSEKCGRKTCHNSIISKNIRLNCWGNAWRKVDKL